MNIKVIPNVSSRQKSNQQSFTCGYAKLEGGMRNMSQGGKLVSESEVLAQHPLVLELTGVVAKVIDYLPAKGYELKQKLALTGADIAKYKKLSQNADETPDLRLFLNKFFVGKFRFTDKVIIEESEKPAASLLN